MPLVLLVIGVMIAVALLTEIIRRLALHARFLDLPVSRSAHSEPVPVGGGLGIVLVYLLATAFLYLTARLPLPELMAVMGGMVIAVVGFIDDRRHLDIRWRIPLQLLAAIWSVWWLGDVPAIAFGNWTLPTSWLLDGLAVVALIWLLNLYNFMDGIDGLAGSELVFVMAATCFLASYNDDRSLLTLAAVLGGAGAGFLVWNWPPARIFMGDTGSGFIGYSLGILALLSMHHGSMNVWTWVLLLGVFIVDATVTLLRRYCLGERWYEGHSSHAYQHASRKYRSHGKVTITILAINCGWLAPLAWLTVLQPAWGMYLGILGVVPLAVVALRAGAGLPATTQCSPQI